jgi:hypothetical protein
VQYDLDPLILVLSDTCNNMIQAVSPVDPTMRETVDLLAELEGYKNGIPVKLTTVTMLGQQGIGKSTMINALLERNWAHVSGGSSACTQFPIRYVYKRDIQNPNSVHITIRFQNAETQRSISIEHVTRTAEYMISTEDDDDQDDHKEFADDLQQYRETAKDYYNICFKTENDPAAREELQKILSLDNIQNGLFLQTLLEKADSLILENGADENGILKLSEVSVQVLQDSLRDMAVISPLEDIFEVAVSADILKYGINLLDAPGNVLSGSHTGFMSNSDQVLKIPIRLAQRLQMPVIARLTSQ